MKTSEPGSSSLDSFLQHKLSQPLPIRECEWHGKVKMPSPVQLGKPEDLFLNQMLVRAEAQNPSPERSMDMGERER